MLVPSRAKPEMGLTKMSATKETLRTIVIMETTVAVMRLGTTFSVAEPRLTALQACSDRAGKDMMRMKKLASEQATNTQEMCRRRIKLLSFAA
jgi:hypothetical protein